MRIGFVPMCGERKGMAFGRDFTDDPFFRDSGMPSMMMHDPFFGHIATNMNQRAMVLRPHDPFALMPFGGGSLFPSMFGGQNPFSAMEHMMQQHHQGMQAGHSFASPDAHSFSSSSVMHYSSSGGGEGQPKVYHATSSTRQAPGGIKETRHSVKDSESGLQKVSIGHQIGDRSHTVERRFNAKTKEREEHQELVNLDETDAREFDSEWKEKTRASVRAVGHDHRRQHLADTRGLAAPGASGKRRGRPASLSKEQLEDDDLYIVGEHKHPHQSTSGAGVGPSTSHHPHHPQAKHSSVFEANSRHPPTRQKSRVLVDEENEEEEDDCIDGGPHTIAAHPRQPTRPSEHRRNSEGTRQPAKQKRVHF